MVKNYEADELAEGSDDEKKIQRAAKAAEKEAEKKAARKKSGVKGHFHMLGISAQEHSVSLILHGEYPPSFMSSVYSGSRSVRPMTGPGTMPHLW